MRVIIVDDECLALDSLVSKIIKVVPEAEVKGFTYPLDALEKVKQGFQADIAFLDIEMFDLNGIELALRLKRLLPKINIIFVTGFSDYMSEAFSMHASGYLTKPIDVEQIQKELDNLRNPIIPKSSSIRIQTFGNFEIFVYGKVVKFQRSRTKELLAYLVDRRGAGVTIGELATVLYEDRICERSLKNQLRVHISDLLTTLKAEKASEIIVKNRNYIALDIEKVDCDYYQFLKGDIVAINSYAGEYMANYSWAELTNGELVYKKTEKN